ncbi:MAG: hypothetical protein IJ794_02370 [Lachnospiraceae bacterium]|nr:hypothetical protein [Lachnospiraceae bacterium]MBR1852012.1 hypothetical protein [Lachnospiraceae bacterium]
MKCKMVTAILCLSMTFSCAACNNSQQASNNSVEIQESTEIVEATESKETAETKASEETKESVAESSATTETKESSAESSATAETQESLAESTETVESSTQVETTESEAKTEESKVAEEKKQEEQQTTQPAQQSTSTSRIDMEHMIWCLENDPSQLTEAEVQWSNHNFPGMYPEDPRQLTPEECRAYNDAYFSNRYSDDYATGMVPEIEIEEEDVYAQWEDREYTQEEINAIAEANGLTVVPYDPNIDTSALDGWEIVWD